MIAYADASLIEKGSSIHSYIIYDTSGCVISKEQMKGQAIDIVEAEITSVINALLKCRELSLRGLTVYTDNLSLVEINERYLNRTKLHHRKYNSLLEIMRGLASITNCKVEWISRAFNKEADELCRKAKEYLNSLKKDSVTYIGDEDNVALLEKRHIQTSKSNPINSESVSEKEKAHMYDYYCGMVVKTYRHSIESIIDWKNELGSVNTVKGRRYHIESFIEKNHTISELNMKKILHAFKFGE